MVNYKNLLIGSVLFSTNSVFANSYTGVVSSCNDGDTCRVVLNQGQNIKVRLLGIDAPESKQEYGTEAQKVLADIVVGRTVALKCDGKTFDRIACEMFINGESVNEDLVAQGYALELPKFSRGRFTQAEKSAEVARRGFWIHGLKQSPYCFRQPHNKRCKNNPLFRG